jgi:hypothetical protein
VKAQEKLFDLPNLTSLLDLGTVTIAGSSGSEFLDLEISFSQSDGTTVDVYFTGVSDVHRGFDAISATVDFGSPKTFQLDGERLDLDIAPISLSIDVGLPGGNHPAFGRFRRKYGRVRPPSGPITGTLVELAPGVPEPSTWAMLLIGFAGIGAMTYRRRRQRFIAEAECCI